MPLGFAGAISLLLKENLPPPLGPYLQPPNSSVFPQLPRKLVLRGWEIGIDKHPHVRGTTRTSPTEKLRRLQSKTDPDSDRRAAATARGDMC
jgi:hypothetical protein